MNTFQKLYEDFCQWPQTGVQRDAIGRAVEGLDTLLTPQNTDRALEKKQKKQKQRRMLHENDSCALHLVQNVQSSSYTDHHHYIQRCFPDIVQPYQASRWGWPKPFCPAYSELDFTPEQSLCPLWTETYLEHRPHLRSKSVRYENEIKVNDILLFQRGQFLTCI